MKPDSFRIPVAWAAVVAVTIVWLAQVTPPTAHGQASETPIADAADIRSVMSDAPAQTPGQVDAPSGIDLLSLILRGGMFMIPIGLMSLLVVTLAVERLLVLRSKRIVPRRLSRELRGQAADPVRFNPTTAFLTCDEYPSAAARVIKAMLMRTGGSLGEIERAASETAQREADRYAAPIRWLNLAAAATPLMGLLGTVWGMIVAFHESTTLTPDRSRSEQLSEGIYTALVTTLAGLVVAIPAAILAQYLENRVTKLFGRVEQLAFDVAPGLTRFVGNSRLQRDGSLHPSIVADRPRRGDRDVAPPPVDDAPPPAGEKTKRTRDGIQTR